ncbi:YjjG family noncanonical pyrimidine nucleotidase [Lacihabitans soyangensis]|uniref:YjjG family noncanonical pyrimidine nucleotidase n=1 Tax=Lacihabitans soyangensis TaxID=869394 RepID=UPI0020CC885E|nr:YjjG family noncanonical pyrimidine nucleotidase [Lacihabitans soyangensis]
MEIRHLFFDLDHTLWHFEKNSEICIKQIYEHHRAIFPKEIGFETFFQKFSTINSAMWNQLDLSLITHEYLRTFRFQKVLQALNIEIDESFSLELNKMLLDLLPHQHHLMDDAFDTLEVLAQRGYKMNIISNGYQDIQIKKMKSGGIYHFFDQIITNDIAGARKPEKAIFDFALYKANADVTSSIMIGDNLIADIEGAKNAGLRTIYFNPENDGNDTENISELKYLLEIL